MARSIVVDLTDEVYETVERKAIRMGCTPGEWLADMATHMADDPFDKHVGSLNSGLGDWGTRHDELLGAELVRESRGEYAPASGK